MLYNKKAYPCDTFHFFESVKRHKKALKRHNKKERIMYNEEKKGFKH